MARPNLISQYMTAPLPCVSEQKRLPFRPLPDETEALYKCINRHVFDNQLTQPEIVLATLQKAWGRCHWLDDRQRRSSWGKHGTWCRIELYDKWFCPQWFCNTLAHEMVHQYQWDIERFDNTGFNIRENSGAHGPSFFAWRDRFAYWGLHLKTAHGQKRWFRHQDFRRC
jgi:hypothetical protein